MEPEEGSNPFKRSGKVQRSPTGRSFSLPENILTDPDVETSDGESRKRKDTSPPTSVSKRRTVGDLTRDDEEATSPETLKTICSEGDYKQKLDALADIGNDLARWASSQYKSKKFTLIQQKEVSNKATEIREIVTSLRMELSFMAGRLSERISIERQIGEETGQAAVSGFPRFAEAVKSREPRVPKITGVSRVQTPKVLFVRSTDERKDMEEVKNVIKKSIRPSKLGVNIKRVIKTARGVLIEAEGADQLEKIKECPELKDKGLVSDKPKRRSPRLMIYDVEPPETEDELIEDIYSQNVTTSDMILIWKRLRHSSNAYIGTRDGTPRTPE